LQPTETCWLSAPTPSKSRPISPTGVP
jgi:hypothetical protein